MPTSSVKSSSNVNSRFKKKIKVKCWCEDLCLVFVSRTPENLVKKFWGVLIIREKEVVGFSDGLTVKEFKTRYDARVKLAYRATTNDVINADGCCFVRGYIVHACFSSIQDLMAVGCYATGIVILKYIAFDSMKYVAFDGI
ncbi:uncharacterized protein LOC128132205 [Lactuca sativa]|uniref:Uncharacterized protein n=1 Tax=Lactuca sativa TaxID=4236 RepID=A0A9R1W5Y1_LACSA|nr:uncharacterized protein LOC128132205 [Lactuca sativa]KAJ0220447.1 hypothetical protein LSAT_V11C200073010 [Lactuca sativa]